MNLVSHPVQPTPDSPPHKATLESKPLESQPSKYFSKLLAMHLFTRIFLEFCFFFFFLNPFSINDFHPILGLHDYFELLEFFLSRLFNIFADLMNHPLYFPLQLPFTYLGSDITLMIWRGS